MPPKNSGSTRRVTRSSMKAKASSVASEEASSAATKPSAAISVAAIIEAGNVDETCNGLRAEITQLQEQLQAAQRELEERVEEHDTATAGWKQRFEESTTEANKKIAAANARIRDLRTKLSSARQEKEELQEKFNEVVGNLSSSLRQITSMEKITSKIVTKLRDWKNRTDETVEDLQTQIDDLVNKLEECEGVVEANQDDNIERFEHFETDLKENRDEQHDLKNEQTNLGNELEKMHNQFTTTSNDLHDLQNAFAANAVESNAIAEGGEEDLGDSQTSNHLTSNKFVAGLFTTHLTVANERTKTTSRRGRTVKLSEKAHDLVLVNDKDARSASKVSSNADRIKGRNLGEQVSQCDFENVDSINTCFPCHKGKGRQDSADLLYESEEDNCDSSDDDQSADLLY